MEFVWVLADSKEQIDLFKYLAGLTDLRWISREDQLRGYHDKLVFFLQGDPRVAPCRAKCELGILIKNKYRSSNIRLVNVSVVDTDIKGNIGVTSDE